MLCAPQNPAGPLSVAEFNAENRDRLIEQIRQAPQQLRHAVAGLTEEQLETVYRNWTIRQIVHHLADSHLHSMIRFKWALTEDHPTIKAYEEGDWVQLADCRFGAIAPALSLLEALHQKWGQLLQSMNDEQYQRTFLHPQSGKSVKLWESLNSYVWHGHHHTAQILWLREHRLS